MEGTSQKEYRIKLTYPEQETERVEIVKALPNFKELFALVGKAYSPSISYYVTLNYKDEGEIITICGEEEWQTYLALLEAENEDFSEIEVFLVEIDQTAGTWEESELGRNKDGKLGQIKFNIKQDKKKEEDEDPLFQTKKRSSSSEHQRTPITKPISFVKKDI